MGIITALMIGQKAGVKKRYFNSLVLSRSIGRG